MVSNQLRCLVVLPVTRQSLTLQSGRQQLGSVRLQQLLAFSYVQSWELVGARAGMAAVHRQDGPRQLLGCRFCCCSL